VLGVVLGTMLSLVSFLFWKMDQRVSFLIKHAESALAELEAVLPTAASKLFSNEPAFTESARISGNTWTRLWTYGRSFRVTFWAVGFFGAAAASLCLLRLFGIVMW
jgi:hypothetical protein